jgi:hypothetical protein
MADAKQKSLEETSKVALDAADAAARAAEEIHNVKKEYDGLLKSNRSVLKSLSIALISSAVGLVLAIGLSALVYFKSRAQFEKSDEMLLQAVAVFAENVDDLTLAQNNLNALIENQNELKNEFGLTRKSLDTVPNRVDEKLDTLLPLVKQLIEGNAQQLTNDLSNLSEISNATLTEQIAAMNDKLASLFQAVSEINTTLAPRQNVEKAGIDAESSSYVLSNVKSDLEQIILLQKELSAKITLLKDLSNSRPVTQNVKKTSTKSSSSKPSNPLKFP